LEWASLISGFEGFFNTVVTENFKNRASPAIFAACGRFLDRRESRQEHSLLRMLKVVSAGRDRHAHRPESEPLAAATVARASA